MTKLVFDAATTWIDEIEATGDLTQVELSVEADEVNLTNFASGGWTEIAGGLKTVEATLTGFWDEDNYAAVLLGWIGTRRTIATITPTGIVNETAYLFSPYQGGFALGAEVGGAGTLLGALKSYDSTGLVRGLTGMSTQTITGDVSGTSIQFAVLDTTEDMVANFHVLSAGTTLDLVWESDDNTDFTTATTRGSATITAAGGTRLTVSGAVTGSDNFWRFRTENVTGSFVVAGAMGIS